MDYMLELIRLHDFVREVHSYYKLNKHLLSGNLVVSRAMVSFAMDGLTDHELDSLIESLKKDGYLLARGNDPLVFSAKFIEGD